MKFEPGDWVWIHLHKERFPSKRKTKLDARGDGPFQVVEKINDNAYKIDLPGEYGVSATFNITDLSHFGADFDSRTNPFEEGGNDASASTDPSVETNKRKIDQHLETRDKAVSLKESFPNMESFNGPVTRSRAKKLKELLQIFTQKHVDEGLTIYEKSKHRSFEQTKLVTLIGMNDLD